MVMQAEKMDVMIQQALPTPHGWCRSCRRMLALRDIRTQWDGDEFTGVKGRCEACLHVVFEPRPVKYSAEGKPFRKMRERVNSWLPNIPCPRCDMTMLMFDEDYPVLEVKCMACAVRISLVRV